MDALLNVCIIIDEEIVSAKIISRGSVLSRVSRREIEVPGGRATACAFHEIVTLNSRRREQRSSTSGRFRSSYDYSRAPSSSRDRIPIL